MRTLVSGRGFFKSRTGVFVFKRNKNPFRSGKFCSKEAFSKALGTGVRGFSLNEISVLRDDSGKPYLKLEGQAEKLAEINNLDFSVSLTHEADLACAVVAAYKKVGGLPPILPERLRRLQHRFGTDLNDGILLDASFVRSVFPKRNPLSHKGSYGKLTVLSGCERYRGAAALCTAAALRSGAGNCHPCLRALCDRRSLIQALRTRLSASSPKR